MVWFSILGPIFYQSMEIHKLVKIGPKSKNHTIFLKEEIMENLNMLSEISFDFFKIPQKAVKLKIN